MPSASRHLSVSCWTTLRSTSHGPAGTPCTGRASSQGGSAKASGSLREAAPTGTLRRKRSDRDGDGRGAGRRSERKRNWGKTKRSGTPTHSGPWKTADPEEFPGLPFRFKIQCCFGSWPVRSLAEILRIPFPEGAVHSALPVDPFCDQRFRLPRAASQAQIPGEGRPDGAGAGDELAEHPCDLPGESGLLEIHGKERGI